MNRLNYPFNDALFETGIGKTKMYGLINSGEIEVCKIGRRTLINGESLRNFVMRNTTTRTHSRNDVPPNPASLRRTKPGRHTPKVGPDLKRDNPEPPSGDKSTFSRKLR